MCLRCTSAAHIRLPRVPAMPVGRAERRALERPVCSLLFCFTESPTWLFSHSHSRNGKMLTEINAETLIFLSRLMCSEVPVLLLGNTCLSSRCTVGFMPTAELSCPPWGTGAGPGQEASPLVLPISKQSGSLCVSWHGEGGEVYLMHPTFIATASGSLCQNLPDPYSHLRRQSF